MNSKNNYLYLFVTEYSLDSKLCPTTIQISETFGTITSLKEGDCDREGGAGGADVASSYLALWRITHKQQYRNWGWELLKV